MAPIIDVPVIIIGGGGCGLMLSNCLSDLNVEHMLFEKHPGTSLLPKAHYLNQRSMETFRHWGLGKKIEAAACPPNHMCRIEFRTSLGGTGIYDRHLLCSVPLSGLDPGSEDWNVYKRASQSFTSNLPLLRLEPILRQSAEERNPGKILFGHGVEDFEEKEDHVLVTVQQPDGQIVQYRAQYVVAADAGKLSRPKLGINMEGPTKIVDFVSTHFKADLSDYWDDRTLFTHFINPEGEKMANFDSGVLVQMGPTWGRHSEEWTLHFGFSLADSTRFDKEALPPRIRQLLKIPDLEMEVLNVSHWVLDRTLADRYRQGRVLIAGDAAHRRPPTTGLGLNTAVEDAQNIAWKLALVVQGKADSALLDTYETERRPVALRNCDWALYSFQNLQVVQAAVGLIPGQTDYNRDRFTKIFADTNYGRMARSHISRVISTQDIEWRVLGLEIGFTYEQGARVSDGTDPPEIDPSGKTYVPSTRPGHRLPHAWIERDGKVISTHDLMDSKRFDFMLITDEDGSQWVEASKRVSKTTSLRVGTAIIRAHPHTIGKSYYYDYEAQWSKLREVKIGGAVLVRPDNFVAWRSRFDCHDAERELGNALSLLLTNPLKACSLHNGLSCQGGAPNGVPVPTRNGDFSR